jgi:hypothetical protein
MLAMGDRKQFSQILHDEVLRLHEQLQSGGNLDSVNSAAVPLHSE